MGEDAVSELVGVLLEAPVTVVEIDGLQLTHRQLRYQYSKVYQQLKLIEREEETKSSHTQYRYTAVAVMYNSFQWSSLSN